MPTENRSSNTEMVSVPRELTPEFHVSYEAYEDSRGESSVQTVSGGRCCAPKAMRAALERKPS